VVLIGCSQGPAERRRRARAADDVGGFYGLRALVMRLGALDFDLLLFWYPIFNSLVERARVTAAVGFIAELVGRNSVSDSAISQAVI
jgi:hypothetical protein